MKTKVWMLAALLVASMWTMTAAALTVKDGCCAICTTGSCDDCCASQCCADKSCCSDGCC